MYLRIPWKLVADTMGSTEDTFGTTAFFAFDV